MVTARELQSKIIDLIYESSDVDQLASIYQDVKSKVRGDLLTAAGLPWEHAMAEVKTRLSFEEIVLAQGDKSLSYETLRQLSDEVAWGSTLDELLEMLDQ